ncbi:hypothetical protein AX16_002011 [Volvariella volvacea WC 439]|nr:hypothetical protein AX16_002011 [Volvariella volvacea WC 439]
MSSEDTADKGSTAISRQMSPVDDTTMVPSPPPFQPYSGQFLDQSSAMSKARWTYIRILFIRTCLIIVAMFAIFSLYWGALQKFPARSLAGWIVDFDDDRIGHHVTKSLLEYPGHGEIKWTVRPASDFPNGLADVSAAVLAEKCWVAIATRPDATARLNATLISGDRSYNGSQAVTAYAVEARNENAYRAMLKPAVEAALIKTAYSISLEITAELLANSNSSIILSAAPETILHPVYFTLQNLRPFDVHVATAVTFVGLIYLLILAFFVVNSGIMARNESKLETQLTTASLIRVRLISPILIYFVLSCCYTLISLMFHLPFHRNFGKGGFIVFWLLSWFGMMAAGLALETMITVLTIKYIQIFLILWIISNVSVCLWPIEMLPSFYGYGHAAPFYQLSRGVRTIIFNAKDELGLNFGILAVWITISCITLPLVQIYRRREAMQTLRKQAKGP